MAHPIRSRLEDSTRHATATVASSSSRPSALTLLVAVGLALSMTAQAVAFCGFYVAKADTKLFNQASKVVLVRDGDRTVLTMANDYEGAPSEFAIVVPVPVVLKPGQVHVASPSLIEHLDAYTAPRLVEYRDGDPCSTGMVLNDGVAMSAGAPRSMRMRAEAKKHGVTIEESFTAGEYDILILSAAESGGLATWLRQNDYRLPAGAETILASYLKQKMKFFVAKVNLGEQQRLGVARLRPLQMAFESRRFGLPIRLGTVNAKGDQDLFVYALTRSGRVETTNYRTRRIPSDVEIPTYVEKRFTDFYRDMFAHQEGESDRDGHGVFLEYAWDMGWCDPCAADPLSTAELREFGVFWIAHPGDPGDPVPLARERIAPASTPFAGQDVFVTRLHVRYDAKSFPEDLAFQTTGDRTNFQGRYVMRHAWEGTATCEAAEQYRQALRDRRDREAETLAELTGWSLGEIRRTIGIPSLEPEAANDGGDWWQRLWPNG